LQDNFAKKHGIKIQKQISTISSKY